MIKVKTGQGSKAASLPLIALTLSLGGAVPALAQDDAPASSSSRPIDFRLPPTDDRRAPGVQGPADNGLPPVAPGERRGQPQPTPAPTPTPTQPAPPPRVAPTQPSAAAPTPAPTPTRRETAAPRSEAVPDDRAVAQPTSPDSAALQPLSPVPESGTPTEPARTIDDAPTIAAPVAEANETPLWAWVLAALAALGVGIWYWRRRTAVAGPVADEGMQVPRPVPAKPRAATPAVRPPASPAPPQPKRAPLPAEPRTTSPLVTRPAAEQRAIVGTRLDIRSIRFAPDHVAVGFTLNLVNQGTLPATGLMVRLALNQGSAMPEAVLARFFDGAGGSVLRDDMQLAVGASDALSTEVMLPRTAIEPLMIGGKPMLVPVIAFDVTYHWDGEGDAFGQNAGSFVLGREQGASGVDKLAPLPLDRATFTVDRPGARATAIKRSQ